MNQNNEQFNFSGPTQRLEVTDLTSNEISTLAELGLTPENLEAILNGPPYA